MARAWEGLGFRRFRGFFYRVFIGFYRGFRGLGFLFRGLGFRV